MQIMHDFKKGWEYDGSPRGFMASERALLNVIGFLQSSRQLMEAGAVVPLLRLAESLIDLRKGRQPALLPPREALNRLPGNTGHAHAVAFAARALDRLMSSKVKSDDAAKQVCKAMKTGKAYGWQDVTPGRVKNWRNKCKSRRTADISAVAVDKYHEKIFVIDPPPAEEAKMLLQILNEAANRGLG